MLKILFWVLLFANTGLLAYENGYLAAWLPDDREPERLAHQLNPESMKPIPAVVAEAKPGTDNGSAGGNSDNGTSSTAKADAASCSEIGGFDQATAKRFDSELQPLALGNKLTHRDVEDVAHNIVYIPPQGSKEGADKKAAELRHLGVNDFYIIQDNGDLHWGISLGVFKTEEAARAQLAALSQKGVHSARLGTRNVTSTKVFYQVRDLDATGRAGLDKVLLDFPHMDKHACGSETVGEKVSEKPGDAKAADTKPTDAKAPDVKSATAPRPVYSHDAIH